MKQQRHPNRGLRKVCGCSRRNWPKCPHSWHFNFKPKGGPAYRFSVDTEAGKHIAAKGDAEALADGWRKEIREGTFRRRSEVQTSLQPVQSASEALTLRAFGEKYFERVGKPASRNTRTCFGQLVTFTVDDAPFGDKPLTAITEDDLDVVFAELRERGMAASTRNKYVQTVAMMFRWAAKKGYLTRNPAVECESLKREKHAQRHRRLEPDEEGRLLAAAGPHLQRLIVGALETACRRGELLSLTWADVNLKRREITIRAERTKTKAGRVLPISARLLGVLEMARADPTGTDFGPECFVFGDVIGRKVGDIKRAWETAVLKAHGHTPKWTPDHSLSADSRAAFRTVDLTFHDLRHEAGSRLLEAGWPLHNVSHMLGHANIAQTSTYLNATRVGLQESMRRLDAARGCNPVANEQEAERAPLRNGEQQETQQATVN